MADGKSEDGSYEFDDRGRRRDDGEFDYGDGSYGESAGMSPEQRGMPGAGRGGPAAQQQPPRSTVVANQHYDEAVELSDNSLDESIDTHAAQSLGASPAKPGRPNGAGARGQAAQQQAAAAAAADPGAPASARGASNVKAQSGAAAASGRPGARAGGGGGGAGGRGMHESTGSLDDARGEYASDVEIPGPTGRPQGAAAAAPPAGSARGGGGQRSSASGGDDEFDRGSAAATAGRLSAGGAVAAAGLAGASPGAAGIGSLGAAGAGAGGGGGGAPGLTGIPPKKAGYNPADFANLAVPDDVRELFEYISRYRPHAIELETRLKPFVPEYIPAVGDPDPFLKPPRPDGKPEELGLRQLDEPAIAQSDPTVLDLQLRALSKKSGLEPLVNVRSIESAEKNPKEITKWVASIAELHKSRPAPSVHYTKTMPDIEVLMQEWAPAFEELLKEVPLPTAGMDMTLEEYSRVICGILDIPVYSSLVQSLHVMFTLYSEFKSNQHFMNLSAAGNNAAANGGAAGADAMADIAAALGESDGKHGM